MEKGGKLFCGHFHLKYIPHGELTEPKLFVTTTVMFLNTVREQTALDCNSLFGKPGDAVVSPPVISPIEQQCTHKHF